MDFFAHQEAARRSTKRFLALYALGIVAIVVAVYGAAALAFVIAEEYDVHQGRLFLLTATATLTVIGAGALYRMLELRRGGPAVAELLGGRAVPLRPTEPKHALLRNLVEEMAIAAGTPVPAIYVLERERGINAFAAGWTPDDAAIAVTRGCLDSLQRDELQGVVAHEFGHIFHGDIRLNIRLMGALAGMVWLFTVGRGLVRVAFSGGSDGKGGRHIGMPLTVFGVLLLLIGGIGVVCARLLQACISRQREFLADASAVQYTRNPLGIGMALARIGDRSARIWHVRCDEANHMMLADGVGSWFASHPPIGARIARVLPGFAAESKDRLSLQLDVAALAPQVAPAGAVRRNDPAALIAAFGAPLQIDLVAARAWLADAPLALAQAVHDPKLARALLCALLLDDDPARRAVQMEWLPQDAELRHDAQSLRLPLRDLGQEARLPLLRLTLPTLSALPDQERETLRAHLRALARADGKVAPYEWALLRLADRALQPGATGFARRQLVRATPLAAHANAVATVLSVLSRAASAYDDRRAGRAFERARAALGVLPQLQLRPAEACTLAAIEQAIDELATIAPISQRHLLAACIEAVADDGVLHPAETELLRAFAAIWDCNLPFAVLK
jgi:Zn-dependent protease with chaperone function